MNKDSKIYVAQHNDLVGKSILTILRQNNYNNIIVKEDNELPLMNEKAVIKFFNENKPEYVFCFAGPHGGIECNRMHPAHLIYENLHIQSNIIHSAYLSGTSKLLFMVGSCVYPKQCPQPMREEYYMTGPMEPTSIAYSTAKAAGIEMCYAYNKQYGTNFIPAVLANNYGPGDDYSDDGHVLAGIMNKVHQAKINNQRELKLWGTGKPMRQFMYSADLAEAAILIMKKYDSSELINIAGGVELSIKELAFVIKDIVDYNGEVTFDTKKPDGAPRKLLSNHKLNKLGFVEKTSFEEGLTNMYKDYLSTIKISKQ